MDEVTRARDSEHLARTKAEREMRDFGEKLLDADDEIKSLRRELSDVERSLHNKELDDKTSTRILESELERLKRDLARREDELDRARNDVKDRERVRQERETLLDKLVNPLFS
jgi:predicted  nucleic acid-binding Zn-ribbon protein